MNAAAAHTTWTPRGLQRFCGWSVVVLGAVFALGSAWEGFCLDGSDVPFENHSGADCTLTPYTRSASGWVQPLVVHGLQRARFTIDAGQTRTLLLETGDYAFTGVVLRCDGDDVVRDTGFPDAWRDAVDEPLRLEPSQTSPPAAADVAQVASFFGAWAPRLGKFVVFLGVLTSPVAALFGFVWLWRSRRRRR